MTSPLKPWEMEQGILRRSSNLQNSPQTLGGTSRTVPPVPPKPNPGVNGYIPSMSNSYIPYSGSSLGYNSYGSMPYRSSLYSSFGGYGGLGSYGNYGNYGYGGYPAYGSGADDAERRFIQYAEESSRNTFASVENVVRAFNSIAMMLDNTFFAMTSSFRAVLSVAENMGRLRTMFGHIWYSVSIFRFINWLYRRMMQFFGVRIPESARQAAWTEATAEIPGAAGGPPPAGSAWPTIAFFGVLLSAPYFINKLMPKYEDKGSPDTWKSPGTRAKVAFDFVASAPNEMSIRTNDEILLAPHYIQEEMKLTNSGWAFAVCNGKSGIIPLNYLVLMKKVHPQSNNININKNNNGLLNQAKDIPRNHVKRVSFGENQIFESTDPPPHKIPIEYQKINDSNLFENKSSTSDNKITEIENKLNTTENMINTTENKIHTTENKLNTTENKLNTVENKLTTFENLEADSTKITLANENNVQENSNGSNT